MLTIYMIILFCCIVKVVKVFWGQHCIMVHLRLKNKLSISAYLWVIVSYLLSVVGVDDLDRSSVGTRLLR